MIENRAWRKPVFLFLWSCGKERSRGEGIAEGESGGDRRREERGRAGGTLIFPIKQKFFKN